MEVTYDKLKQMPKVDLHLHLDGGLRVKTIYELAKEQNYKLPTDDIEKLKEYVQVPRDCRSLADFLKAFETFYPILMNPSAMERVAYEVSEDCFRDNVKYCEIRFAPILQAKGKYSMEEILQGVLKGLARAHYEFGIINPLILCCYRSESPESSIETVNLALKYRDRGIVGIDLAGDEEHFPAEIHKEAFKIAYENKLQITVHAGEAGSAKNIEEAIKVLKANRIGHGIHIVDDKELYEYAIETQIPFEMCLTSNVQTTVAKDYETHPFLKCFRDGLKVTINTDDPGVSNITLTDEYYLLKKYYNFGWKEIIKVLENGIDSSFTTKDRKEKLKNEFKEEVNKLLGEEIWK
jgi:adenosine deaminase